MVSDPPLSSSSYSNKTASTMATTDAAPTTSNSKNAATTDTTLGKNPRFGFGKSKSSKKVTATDPNTKEGSSKSGNILLKLSKKVLSSSKYPKGKMVKDSIPVLEEELKVLTKDAPLLDTEAPCQNLCLLDRKEVQVGKFLGEGQFASVYHVTGLSLRAEEKMAANAALGSLSPEVHGKRKIFVQAFNDSQQSQEVQLVSSSPQSIDHDRNHADNCQRYAIKHMKRDLLLSPARRRKRNHNRYGNSAAAIASGRDTIDLPLDQQFQLAAADLIVEAQYLSRLRNPHVIRIRGMAAGGASAFANGRYDSFFLILDKLSETLHQRIRHWRKTMGNPLEAMLPTKTYYAYQIAVALEYLHKKRIIFRDLKPSNAGFKEGRDDQLQIFDFGLCRELPKSSSSPPDDPNEVFFMTAAGTHRYMAVEILQGDKYSLKADTYSFAMVFYEVLAQEAPFANLDEADIEMLVCERQHRPHHFFGCVVPQSIQKLLEESWAHEIKDRLTMSQVVSRLEDILATTFQKTLRENESGVKVLESACSGEEKAPMTT